MIVLQCLNCKTTLEIDNESCVCPQCRAEWPVTGGIPRFFQMPSYYWGEIGRVEARELLKTARMGSWIEAVRARFGLDTNMIYSMLDFQRASWVPMLGLDESAVALDIGCGYGAITHAISRVLGEIYSVEAIPERIEFTQERLRQENIRNVRLIQASAMALPFVENSFDLVVVNGILEWVGEWDLKGSPRGVQLRFLRDVGRLLKPDGLLVIGIENRVGYDLLLGSTDHSGIPFTSLVPRRMASFMLRHSSTPHHRTKLNSNREYRTYTYSEQGYRKLLTDAGFAAVSCYWATPGYNQPHHLVPLTVPPWIRELFFDLSDHPSRLPRASLRRRLKRAFAHLSLLPLVLPEFVLVASGKANRRTKFQIWLEEQLSLDRGKPGGLPGLTSINWSLRTHAFAQKSVIRLADAATGRDAGYLRVCVGSQADTNWMDVEISNCARIVNGLNAGPNKLVGVPRALGTLRVGNILYSLESAAQGTSLSRIVYAPNYFTDERRVERDFARVIEAVIELTEVLHRISGVAAINPSCRETPEEFKNQPLLLAAIQQGRCVRGTSSDYSIAWTQHGDLSVENIFLDLQTGRIEVIDWADLASGLPPLYDLFTLFFSTAYLAPRDESVRFETEEERWIASFEAMFFCDTGFARIVKNLTLHACDRLGLPAELLPALLLEFLLVRCHYYENRSEVQRAVCVRLLQAYLEQGSCLFGKAI